MSRKGTFWPRQQAGRVSSWITLGAFILWILLPLTTSLFRESVPVTDTWVMPFIGVVGIAGATVVNIYTFAVKRQRSVANLIALVATLFFTLFTATFFIGEGLSGL